MAGKRNTNGNDKISISQSKGFRITVLVASFLLSVIVTLISAFQFNSASPQLTGQQVFDFDAINIGISLLLGCSTFIIIELIALVVNAIEVSDQKKEHDNFMEDINEYSTMLHEINSFYYDVSRDSHGQNDLFVTYAKKEIEKLNNTLRLAANQREFSVSSDYILNAAGVFDAFSKSTSKVLRMTFPISDEDDAIFTSPADSHFFEILQKEVEADVLSSVQVIVIAETPNTMGKDCGKKLLDFFAAEDKYECKICLEDTFKSVCDTNGVPSQFLDFGIYGDKMLFVAEQYIPIHKGSYYKDTNRIRLYTQLFDEIWKSDILADNNTSTNTTAIKVADLIKCDDTTDMHIVLDTTGEVALLSATAGTTPLADIEVQANSAEALQATDSGGKNA